MDKLRIATTVGKMQSSRKFKSKKEIGDQCKPLYDMAEKHVQLYKNHKNEEDKLFKKRLSRNDRGVITDRLTSMTRISIVDFFRNTNSNVIRATRGANMVLCKGQEVKEWLLTG